jgi:hypothetical protein
MIGMLFSIYCSNNPAAYNSSEDNDLKGDMNYQEVRQIVRKILVALKQFNTPENEEIVNFMLKMLNFKGSLTYQQPTMEYLVFKANSMPSSQDAFEMIIDYLTCVLEALNGGNIALALKWYDFMVIKLSGVLEEDAMLRTYQNLRPSRPEETNYGLLSMNYNNKYQALRANIMTIIHEFENPETKNDALVKILKYNFLK